MPGSPSNGSNAPADAFASEAEPIVRDQTVKAWNPLMAPPPPPATESTVKAPMPPPPPAATESTVKAPMPPPPPQEQTVRTRVPTPPPDDLPWSTEFEVPLVEAHEGVPVSRSNAPTLPEAIAPVEPEPVPLRTEPPAVSGEMSVMDPEPIGMFDPRPPRPTTEPVLQAVRPTTEPALQAARSVRDDPPAVSGEVAIEITSSDEPVPPVSEISVMPMTSSGPLPLLSPGSMTASGHQPALHPSCFAQRPGTDPGSYVGAAYTDSTGPQPLSQAETTGPQVVLRTPSRRVGTDRTLWYVALALVLLAVGGVVLVVSRAS